MYVALFAQDRTRESSTKPIISKSEIMTAAHPQTAFDISNKNITSSQTITSNRFNQNSLLSIMSNPNNAMNRFGDEILEVGNRSALPPRSTADSSDADMAAKHAQDNDGASSVGDDDGNQGENSRKRYLPDHKKPDAAPTFPEKVRSFCFELESDFLSFVCFIFDFVAV